MNLKSLLYLTFGLLFAMQLNAQKKLLPIRSDQKWGFIDSAGNVVVKPKYVAVGRFNGKKYTNFATHNSLGIVSTTGKELFFKNVNGIKVLDHKTIVLRKDTFWGAANYESQQILDYKYSDISITQYGYLKVRIGDSLGIRDRDGKKIAQTRYLTVKALDKSTFYLQTQDSAYIINKHGQRLLEIESAFTDVNFYPTLIIQTSNNKYKVLSLLNPAQIEDVTNYSRIDTSNLLLFNKAKSAGIYNPTDGIVFNCNHQIVAEFNSDNNIFVKGNERVGLLSNTGKTLMPLEFTKIIYKQTYYEGWMGNSVGMYGTDGKEWLTPVYDDISYHNTGVFIIQRNMRLGVAKTNGTILIPTDFEALEVDQNQIRGIRGIEISFFDLDAAKNIVEFYKFKNVKTVVLDARVPLPINNSLRTDSVQFGWFIPRNSQKWGFRRADSSLRHAPTFDRIKHFPQTGFTITTESIFVNKKEKVLDGFYYQDKKTALAFTENGNYFLTPKYWHVYKSELRKADCNYVRALTFAGNQQVILRNGQILKKVFSFIDTLEEDMARFNVGGTHVLHKNQKTRTTVYNELVYKEENGFDSTNYSIFRKNALRENQIEICYGKWGYLNKNGDIAIDAKFDFVQQFYKGAAIVQLNGKLGVINKLGEFIIEPEYFNIKRLEQNGKVFFYVYKPKPRFGIVDTAGQTLVYPEYQKATNFCNNRLAVKSKKGWTFLDTNLTPIHEHYFDEVRPFKNERAAVKKHGKWGFISMSGTLTIPFVYREVMDFNNGVTWAKEQGNWIIINKTGQLQP